jgi:hypothetical protein
MMDGLNTRPDAGSNALASLKRLLRQEDVLRQEFTLEALEIAAQPAPPW